MSNETPIDFQELQGEAELVSIEDYGDNLIEWAVERQVSDIFLSDDRMSVAVSVRRLGRIELIRRLARGYGNRLQGHFRVIAGADAGDFIRPAEGRGTIRTPSGLEIDYRLSAMPTLFGQDVSIRLFDNSWASRSITDLGMDEDVVVTLSEVLNQSSGLVLVSGPVGSGKTSTLYSSINYLNDGTRKIHTLEDPVEHAISGVNQSQVNLRAGVDFADLLTAVLRHSPDVIMIGEIRDVRTAAAAVRAGASGQMVLATVHADSAAEAIDTMRQYDINRTFLASTLIAVVNQRLIRKLCVKCRQQIASDGICLENPRVAARLDEQQPVLYRSVGCESCLGSGFDSLTCLPELMLVCREVEQAIIDGMPSGELQRMAIDAGMISLADAALVRVLRGETTAAEAMREVDDPALNRLAAAARNAEPHSPAEGYSPYG